MKSMYYKTFVWFLLIGIYKIVYTGAKLEENIEKMKSSLINTKSIFIDGNRVVLDDWAPVIIKNTKFENNKDARKMFTFLKCECAHLINTSIYSVIDFIKPCSDEILSSYNTRADVYVYDLQPCVTDNEKVMENLRLLNKDLKLTITRLFQIIDQNSILRSDELYMMRTLMSASCYLESFTYATIQDNIELDKPQVLRILRNMKRALLQIMNLIGQYALEYCYPNENDENIIAPDKRGSIKELNILLTGMISGTSSPYNWIFDVDAIKLKKCMTIKNDSDLCHEYFRTTEIKINDGVVGWNNGYTRVHKLFDLVEDSYDFYFVYEYMVTVYQVILKYIYLKTKDQWSSLGVDRCREIIAKLKSMFFPTEIIYHFQLLLDVGSYKSVIEIASVNNIFENKFDSVENVKINVNQLCKAESRWVNLSLSGLMDYVLENEIFQQFWPVFNLLYKAFERKSPTYDMSLNVVPEEAFDPKIYRGIYNISPNVQWPPVYSDRYKVICDLFTDVTEYLSKIKPTCEKISNKLFQKLQKGLKPSDIRGLNEAYSAAYIQLKNYNEFQCQNDEILIRTVNLTWNMLDNYAIRKCKDIIKNRQYAFRNKYYKNKIDNVSENWLINLKDKMLPIITKNKKDKKTTFCGLEMSNPLHSKKSRSKKPNDNNINNEINIDETVYDFAKLTAKEIIEKSSLGTTVHFNRHGEIQSLQGIHTDLSKNMLNIQDLVDYQRLCFTMLLYVIFETWFVMFEQKSRNQVKNNIDTDLYNKSLKDLKDSFKELELPRPCEKYGQYYLSKLELHSFIGKHSDYSVGIKTTEFVRNEIMKPMAEFLGIIVKDNHVDIDDIKKLLCIKEDIWNTAKMEGYSILVQHLNTIIIEFKTNFTHFWMRRSQYFVYTNSYEV